MLAGAGGAIGVGFAYGAVAALRRFGPADTPRLAAIAVDGQVLVYALVGDDVQRAAVRPRAGVAARARRSRRDAEARWTPRRRIQASTDAPGACGGRRSRWPSCSSSRAGCCCAASWRWWTRIPDSGPRAPSPRPSSFRPRGTTRTAATAFYARAVARVRSLPGVREATFTSDLPWTGYDENTGFSIVGRQFPRRRRTRRRATTSSRPATRTRPGTPLVAGRDLSPSDVEGRAARAPRQRKRRPQVLERR